MSLPDWVGEEKGNSEGVSGGSIDGGGKEIVSYQSVMGGEVSKEEGSLETEQVPMFGEGEMPEAASTSEQPDVYGDWACRRCGKVLEMAICSGHVSLEARSWSSVAIRKAGLGWEMSHY